jgi:LmbE family N-acetylglucosaminyl deacetylase
MKLRIYFKPTIIVLALATASLLSCGAWFFSIGILRWLLLAVAAFYIALFLIAAYSLARCHAIESWTVWTRPERLLILAPHQDDCVICGGGIGILNAKLGGETYIAYLVQDDKPGLAERRKDEAVTAWSFANVPANHLRHLDLFPPLYRKDPIRLRKAATELRQLIEEINPTVLLMPMFEGGHIHHDLTNLAASSMLVDRRTIRVFEAPEYSPFLSLRWTPHKIISLCGRWLLGLVAYYGPPDGIDGRPVYKVRLNELELALKGRMLAAFVSQNGESLAVGRAYPDRIAEWRPRASHRRPFELKGSYLSFVQFLERLLPGDIINVVFPGQRGTIGREPSITDLNEEVDDLVPESKI